MAGLVAAQPQHPTLAARNRARVRLWLPHPSLSGCVRAIVSRSTLGIGRQWPESWRYSYFPASPLCGIRWFSAGRFDLVDAGSAVGGGKLSQCPHEVLFGGPHTKPIVSRNGVEGHTLLLLLLPDAFQAMTGLSPAAWLNRSQPLYQALAPDWQRFSDGILAAPDDDARVALIEDFLLPRWLAVRPQTSTSGLSSMQAWTEALALRAATSGTGHSLRQAERRIKGWTGLPMRDLRGLVRSEQVYFRMIEQDEDHIRWADVAADAGYSDQSHLCRETSRVTGFAPAELRSRIAEDESFWIYRIWT